MEAEVKGDAADSALDSARGTALHDTEMGNAEIAVHGEELLQHEQPRTDAHASITAPAGPTLRSVEDTVSQDTEMANAENAVQEGLSAQHEQSHLDHLLTSSAPEVHENSIGNTVGNANNDGSSVHTAQPLRRSTRSRAGSRKKTPSPSPLGRSGGGVKKSQPRGRTVAKKEPKKR
ncbi:hypothetical protein M011DRAFT_477220 [Sporormia fimetaria CBS 119925]|uniref:Uncharacterized protein n=1 Tax=Sporormia fimetaria CBS 119925 TaxID=1340428 RepID=A0A6A6VAG5_9PLEO|nr:hypothetical protein M011DRAFT_477220 [Sporormia fimetaria CBS 119925]